jgi:ATP-dependent protease ClpP protease subunit
VPYWGNEIYQIEVIGDIDGSLLDDWRMPFNKDMPVSITIDSPGGCIASALGIADLIAKHRGTTTAVVPANAICHSAACIIFSAARARRAHVSAEFLIHNVAIDPGSETGRWTKEEHLAVANRLEALDSGVLRLLAQRCGKPLAMIQAAVSENPITALTAADLGLVHEIEW